MSLATDAKVKELEGRVRELEAQVKLWMDRPEIQVRQTLTLPKKPDKTGTWNTR